MALINVSKTEGCFRHANFFSEDKCMNMVYIFDER